MAKDRFSIRILGGNIIESPDTVLYFDSAGEVEKEMMRLYDRKRKSVALNPRGEIIGRVLVDGSRAHYWLEPL
jgi:hypothetical protein